MILIFDTETTGLPRSWNAPLTDSDNWPRIVSIAWQLHTPDGRLLSRGNRIVRPDGFTIPFNAIKVHGITNERAAAEGHPLAEVLADFLEDSQRATYLMGHNVGFDISVVGAELHRLGEDVTAFTSVAVLDSKDAGTDLCKLPGGRGGAYKWPTLSELHDKLFNEPVADAHDAAYDVRATGRIFFAMCTLGAFSGEGLVLGQPIDYESPELEASAFAVAVPEAPAQPAAPQPPVREVDPKLPFSHLHVHSQFSVLQAVSSVHELVEAAAAAGMPALALTDHGNMMGAFQFVRAARKAGILPIVGIELNVCRDMHDKSTKDDGYPVVLLAMNKAGYHRLARLSSAAYTDGFYYVPRVDRALLATLADDLICLSGGLFSEVPSLILNVGERQAEEAFLWYKGVFGDRFYAELNRHGLEEEEVVNRTLLALCARHGVACVAAHSTYYTRQDQAEAHDILLCVKDAANASKPKRYLGKRGREFRFGMPNDRFYLCSPAEMRTLFADVPEALENVDALVKRCEPYALERDVLLPAFDIPAEFIDPRDAEDGGKRGENAYLRHLTYLGAERRYGTELSDAIRERLDFELETIANTGYPGYFLIVQDFTTAARNMGVSVGPGRGSAAGSAVAYCVGITNVDPIAYDLLFERFLNPDRVSLPDIDIDFDDEGRGKVIDYVIRKYGANQVAQIITYGTMAAKSSVRDTARVLELPLSDADRLAKMLPDVSLAKLFRLNDQQLKEELRSAEELESVRNLRKLADTPGLEGRTLTTARELEGSLRNTGIHACGIIITPTDLTDYVPIATAKDSDMVCTQFDNAVAEEAGLLKMDFLGLKTLTIIRDAVANIQANRGLTLDPDAFPLDDERTYALFQRGETVGIFQYESAGMQKYLRELKPTVFADLIAMNALYRPGPLEYIPSFIRRKHGTEPIVYDLPACEGQLAETYGITVYQEQVMLLSQQLAGFTKGEADTLRKAMGKKKADLIAKMKPQFLSQGEERGHDRVRLEKIWKDWEAFAAYAFNKSHSTCYALVAYQTAYLKANFPAEYMAAVLSNNMSDIKQVAFFMEEARRMGIAVLGPDVNESGLKFTVNRHGAIRFGLGAVRGVGEGAVVSIVAGREDGDGPYRNVFDLARRAGSRDVGKRVLEALAVAGAFDGFGDGNRARYFAADDKGRTGIELAARFGAGAQEAAASAQASLFGEGEIEQAPEPVLPSCEPWDPLVALTKEKEVIGMFISGHPLDAFAFEMKHLCSPAEGLAVLSDPLPLRGRELRFAGRIAEVAHRLSKQGKPFGNFTLEDLHGTERFALFGDDYMKFKDYLVEGWFVWVRGAVEPRRFRDDPNDVEFRIKGMELLADLREKLLARVRIVVPADRIDASLVGTIEGWTARHPGGVGLSIDIAAPEGAVQFVSRTRRIGLTDEALQELEGFAGPAGIECRFEWNRIGG
jgi:DNA polymerase-3 subunit alpha